MNNMEFKEILKRKIDYIEELLNEYMPKEEGYQHRPPGESQ